MKTPTRNRLQTLLQESGVFVQKSQMGGGSPILRGFEANKILLVVDNIRLNNAIFRSGHLQNSTMIDPFLLKRSEVILGLVHQYMEVMQLEV